MDQSEPDLPSHLGSVESRIENKETMTGETEDEYENDNGRIISSSPTGAEFGDSPSDRTEEMAFDGYTTNWEEEGNFSTSCENGLDPIALPCSANYEEMNAAYNKSQGKENIQIYDEQSAKQSPQESFSDGRTKNETLHSPLKNCTFEFPMRPWQGPDNETQQPIESPNFNTDLENLFSTEQQGDVLSPSTPGVCGLCNLGNTCFMNSGLQCLLNTPTMVQFFMKQIPEDTANPDSLAAHFTNLFHKVWSGKYSKVKPTEFHQALGAHHSQFKDYRQHDCQEFLALVLGSLHELLNTASSKSHVSDLSADPMTPHSTCEEDRESSGARNPMQESTDHDSGSQMALSITGLRCEASSSSHSSESSIGASQIRMRPLPEDVQPFKSVQSTGSVLWEAMDSITEGTDDNMAAPMENVTQLEENACVNMDETGSNIISDNALKKDTKSFILHDKSRLEKNEVASLNNSQCFRGYEDILKDAKTSNVNVLVTEQGANNEIVFDSDKFPKHESTRRRDALENPNLTEFHNFDGKAISIKRIKETNKLHDQTETTKDYLAIETFYNSNNKRFKLAENLEKEKNYRMEIERKLCDDTNGIDPENGGAGEFSGAAALNNPIDVDDELEADKQWEKHLGHNQSVIVDSFQGQFKSTIVCSECRYVSSTYEPFMYLSVPLPHAMEQQICVTFVPANSEPPTKYLLTLNKQDKIIKIKEHLRKVMKANVTMNLELAEVLHHHIARILDENLFIRYLGINDPHRSIYAFEISDEITCSAQKLTNVVTSTKEDCEDCQTETPEPLDLTPEQGSPVESNKSNHKKLYRFKNAQVGKLNNRKRRIPKANETETKSNISSTINNNLKACSEPCVNNLFDSTPDEPLVEYGPHLEHQGDGDAAWGNEKTKPMETNENNDWKSCAICLEEVERGLKNHKGCSCFLCDNCIERSVKHYSNDENKGLMKCPVCNDLVDPKKVFVVVDDVSEFRTSIRMLKVPVLFRQDVEGEGNNNEKRQKLFGHPHLIKVANRLKGSELYEVVGKLVPYNACYSIVLVDGQGYHCSRCMYTVHCKGCKISEDTEISLQTGDNLAVRFTSSVVEIPAIEDPSLKELRNQEQLSLYDCLDAFSESETLDEHNPWYCPTCQRNQCATKTLSVWRYPDFLIVYLKRFVFHEYTSVKLDNKVSFPLTGLNLVPPSRIQQGTAKPYNLYACVNHFGGASAGHYTAYAKNPQSGDWHLFNDETVTAQKPQEEDYSNAYVLFYQKQGVNFNRNLPNSFLNDATVKPIEQLILDLDSSVEQDTWHESIAQTSKS